MVIAKTIAISFSFLFAIAKMRKKSKYYRESNIEKKQSTDTKEGKRQHLLLTISWESNNYMGRNREKPKNERLYFAPKIIKILVHQ